MQPNGSGAAKEEHRKQKGEERKQQWIKPTSPMLLLFAEASLIHGCQLGSADAPDPWMPN
jgi:hypothetical protein